MKLPYIRIVGAVICAFAVPSFGEIQDPAVANPGNTAWMIMATALVMLMSMPGLALFYGGLAKRKDVLNVIAMSFVAYCLVSVLWVGYGYSLTFGTDIGGVIGNFEKVFMNTVTVSSVVSSIPEQLFAAYQLTFAAITVALASGAYIERMKLSAWLLFAILWFSLVYIPVAHWVWGGGFLAKMGVLDFAGGIVVHLNAGIAALVGALFLGRRRHQDLLPNNLVFAATGLGLLWFGWFGFNAGSALGANGLATAAFINTNTAAAMAALAWMGVEWLRNRKPTVLGMISGAVAGLATVTPAAGYVNMAGALSIGLCSGIVLYYMVAVVKHAFRYDDTLDAFGIHGVGGILGTLLTGVLADPAVNPAARGLLFGNPGQLGIQLIGVVVPMVYGIAVTAVIFVVLKKTTGLRVAADDELSGLDMSQHGEQAYNLT